LPRHDEPSRDLPWPSCFNARDLGGYDTADGRRTGWRAVVRADNLCHLTGDGQAALVRDGVRTVVDLLSQSEHAFEPPHPFRTNTADQGVPRYVHVPLVDEGDRETAALVDHAPSREASYRLMLDRCRGQIAAIARAIVLAPPGGVLFHCHAGLDRTGLIAALLLGLVGVPGATIVADYALSEERLGSFYEHYRALIADPAARGRFKRLTAPPTLMASILADIDARYGGAEPYLLGAGLSRTDCANLRTRLLGG
jgi:protein-tyrosine phosphatase